MESAITSRLTSEHFMQVVAYDGFIKTTKPDLPERVSALAALRKEYDIPETNGPGQHARLPLSLKDWPDDRRNQFENKLAEMDKQYPGELPATVKDFVDHIDYAVKLIGIDHVGISSDFDGGGGVIGWNDTSETFAVTLELVRHGYTEAQIEKLWGGNLLRVMPARNALVCHAEAKQQPPARKILQRRRLNAESHRTTSVNVIDRRAELNGLGPACHGRQHNHRIGAVRFALPKRAEADLFREDNESGHVGGRIVRR